jgi:hypothetical protein
MIMKTHILPPLSVVVLAVATILAASAAPDLPKAPSFARYEEMMNKSPFAVATAVATPAATPNFAKDLYIANAAKLADEGVVTLASSTDKNLKEYLSTKGPNKNGYSISNIEWSDRVGATKVTIAKDGQFATLTFNQALISQPVANAPAPAIAQPQIQPPPIQTPAPGQALSQQTGVAPQATPYATPASNTTIKPAPIPTLPTPPPRVRGVIQRNPQGAQTPAQPGAAPQNDD